MITVNPDNLPYRPSVGVALFNKEGHVLIGQRTDDRGFWQMPQTGIRHDETITAAARRTLADTLSLSISDVHMMAVTTEWLHCDLPGYLLGREMNGRYRGDEQKWIAARYLGDPNQIDIDHVIQRKFSAWRWESIQNLPGIIVPYKRHIYQTVGEAFQHFAVPVSEASPAPSQLVQYAPTEPQPQPLRETADVIKLRHVMNRSA